MRDVCEADQRVEVQVHAVREAGDWRESRDCAVQQLFEIRTHYLYPGRALQGVQRGARKVSVICLSPLREDVQSALACRKGGVAHVQSN